MKNVIPHFTAQDLIHLKKVSNTFENLLSVFVDNQHYVTFEKFNKYGKFPKDSTFMKEEGETLTAYRGSEYGLFVITSDGHRNIADRLLKADLLASAGDTDLQVNTKYLEAIGNALKSPAHNDIAQYDIPIEYPLLKDQRIYDDE